MFLVYSDDFELIDLEHDLKGTATAGVLLLLRPHAHVPVLINHDMNDVRAAANEAILDVLLRSRNCWRLTALRN